MKPVNDRLLRMPRSGIRGVMDVVESMSGPVTRLEVGQPHFPTPEHIIKAAFEAAEAGFTKYTPNHGLAEVRERIAAKISRDYPALQPTADDIVLTVGGVYAIALAMLAFVKPGHKVMIPDPGWPNYTLQAITANTTPLYYPLHQENQFKPDVAELGHLVTPDTDLIVVNSPSNPTGTVLGESDLEALVRFAHDHDLWVVSDEVYDKVIYEGEHVPLASLDEDARVITVNSFSKTYSMTGWRLGYLLTSPKTGQELSKLSEALISCPSSISQKAAEAAVTGPQDSVAKMVRYYKQNRDLAVRLLESSGATFVPPHGAFYVLIDIANTGLDSSDFSMALLQSERVSVAPGQTFGPSGNRFVRASFCTDRSEVKRGIEGIVRFLSDHQSSLVGDPTGQGREAGRELPRQTPEEAKQTGRTSQKGHKT